MFRDKISLFPKFPIRIHIFEIILYGVAKYPNLASLYNKKSEGFKDLILPLIFT